MSDSALRIPGPEAQVIEEIPAADLLARVQRMHAEGWRLVQACCTRLVDVKLVV